MRGRIGERCRFRPRRDGELSGMGAISALLHHRGGPLAPRHVRHRAGRLRYQSRRARAVACDDAVRYSSHGRMRARGGRQNLAAAFALHRAIVADGVALAGHRRGQRSFCSGQGTVSGRRRRLLQSLFSVLPAGDRNRLGPAERRVVSILLHQGLRAVFPRHAADRCARAATGGDRIYRLRRHDRLCAAASSDPLHRAAADRRSALRRRIYLHARRGGLRGNELRVRLNDEYRRRRLGHIGERPRADRGTSPRRNLGRGPRFPRRQRNAGTMAAGAACRGDLHCLADVAACVVGRSLSRGLCGLVRGDAAVAHRASALGGRHDGCAQSVGDRNHQLHLHGIPIGHAGSPILALRRPGQGHGLGDLARGSDAAKVSDPVGRFRRCRYPGPSFRSSPNSCGSSYGGRCLLRRRRSWRFA